MHLHGHRDGDAEHLLGAHLHTGWQHMHTHMHMHMHTHTHMHATTQFLRPTTTRAAAPHRRVAGLLEQRHERHGSALAARQEEVGVDLLGARASVRVKVRVKVRVRARVRARGVGTTPNPNLYRNPP